MFTVHWEHQQNKTIYVERGLSLLFLIAIHSGITVNNLQHIDYNYKLWMFST